MTKLAPYPNRLYAFDTKPYTPPSANLQRHLGGFMTIAAGFRCSDGLVLCADTLVTVPGVYKQAKSKIKEHQSKSYKVFLSGQVTWILQLWVSRRLDGL